MRRFLALYTLSAFVLLAGDTAFADLALEQVSNGFPGSERKSDEKGLTKQKLLLKGDKLKIVSIEEPLVCIVRLDKKVVWEINNKEKTFVERQFSYFEKVRKDNLAQRNQEIREINGKPNPKEREEDARKLGYRLKQDGTVDEKILPQIERKGEKKKVADYECERVILKEDERTVFDMWVTDKIKVPESLMKFYEELGGFSKEVLEKLKELKEFPLELKVELNVGAVSFKIEAQVTKVDESVKIDEKEFELPEGLQKVKEITGEGEKELGERPCVICGKMVNLQDEKNVFRFTHRGVTYILCSKEHRTEFRDLLVKHGGKTDFLQEPKQGGKQEKEK
jgi:YHS domain-containing protein